MANNSAVYNAKPGAEEFLDEWTSLVKSKSGERGIFNRVAAIRQAANTGRRQSDYEFGTNPCGEIILRPFGFCNLSEIIVRSTDTDESLADKVELATILGTFQSTLTDFKYIREDWKRNAEEERLLGVSMTGIMDSDLTRAGAWGLDDRLKELKDYAVDINNDWAGRLDIRPSASITTVKPSGTVSQLVDSASGIHPRYSNYYVRTVRADVKDPLALFLQDAGVPNAPDITNPSTLVFDFPIAAPPTAVTRNEVTAIGQLEHYLKFKQYWCEHNPSITVYVRDHEWMDVGAWVFKYLDDLGGVAFLPMTDHVYQQAPYQEITKEKYEELLAVFPAIDWHVFDKYETTDTTTGSQELACSAGQCEII